MVRDGPPACVVTTIPPSSRNEADPNPNPDPDPNSTKAKGSLQVSCSVIARSPVMLTKENYPIPLPGDTLLGACMGWEMLGGSTAVDVDASCVGIDQHGKILMDETVYFADLTNTNGAMRHSGDEREGDEDLTGQGDDEIIYLNLSQIPSRVFAMIIIGTVSTEGKAFSNIKVRASPFPQGPFLSSNRHQPFRSP